MFCICVIGNHREEGGFERCQTASGVCRCSGSNCNECKFASRPERAGALVHEQTQSSDGLATSAHLVARLIREENDMREWIFNELRPSI